MFVLVKDISSARRQRDVVKNVPCFIPLFVEQNVNQQAVTLTAQVCQQTGCYAYCAFVLGKTKILDKVLLQHVVILCQKLEKI